MKALMCLVLLTTIFARAGDAEDALKGANLITDAMIKGNWDVALKSMDPKVLQKMEVSLEELEDAVKEIKAQFAENGVKILKCVPKLPDEVIIEDSYRVTFLTTKMKMKVGETKVSGKGLLIGVKYNGQKEWKYVDATSMSREEIFEFYPELPGKVKIPKVGFEVEK